MLALTCRHASHTNRLGIANDLSLGFGNASSLPPGAWAPVDRIDIPGEPAPSLHRHPSEQRLLSYYEPVRQRAPQPVLSAFGLLPRHAPSRDLGACDPGRHIAARLLTFRARAADQAHIAYTPGTAWPVIGYLPGSSRGTCNDLRFRCRLENLRRFTSARPTRRTLLERLPGPHLTRQARLFPDRSPRRSSTNAAPGGLAPTPEGRRQRANNPPSLAQHRFRSRLLHDSSLSVHGAPSPNSVPDHISGRAWPNFGPRAHSGTSSWSPPDPIQAEPFP